MQINPCLSFRPLKILSFIIVISILLYHFPNYASATEITPDINTILMKSTFRIEGNNGKMGTIFIVGKPYSGRRFHFILITAAHILESLNGETATVFLRRQEGHSYIKIPYSIKIRQNERALWVKHPIADVAAMYITLPKSIDILLCSMQMLATDEILKKFEIYPGRGLKVLGFPFGLESHASGFPVLRTGSIASFPLTPSKELATFLMDFTVYGGNSGGPVYFHDPDWHKRGSGGVMAPVEVQMIVGLVSKQKIFPEKVKSYMQETLRLYQIQLAEIVHASLIKGKIELLPEKPLAQKNKIE